MSAPHGIIDLWLADIINESSNTSTSTTSTSHSNDVTFKLEKIEVDTVGWSELAKKYHKVSEVLCPAEN